jgi:putative ABC transport system permease protein
MLAKLMRKLAALTGRTAFSRGLDEEMAFHREQIEEDLRDRGMSAEEAHYAAMRQFGNGTRIRERSHELMSFRLETVAQDVRYGLRGFRRSKAFAISAVLTLALGIGATTAVFSVVDPILFRALPYADAGRLVSVGFTVASEPEEFMTGRFYLDWQANHKPFAAIASQGDAPHPCDLVENHPAELECVTFQAGMLPMLGISPVLGRNFLPEEDVPHGPPVVMISYALWQGHYGGDRQIIGREINIDGNLARVVGVLPRDFQFPALELADVVKPMSLNAAVQNTVNGGFGDAMRTFARLKPGVSLTEAQAEVQPVSDPEMAWLPERMRNLTRLSIRPLREREMGDARRMAWILLGAVAAVLLIACANVAGLIVARGAGAAARAGGACGAGSEPLAAGTAGADGGAAVGAGRSGGGTGAG